MKEKRQKPEERQAPEPPPSMIVAPPFWTMSIEAFCGQEARS